MRADDAARKGEGEMGRKTEVEAATATRTERGGDEFLRKAWRSWWIPDSSMSVLALLVSLLTSHAQAISPQRDSSQARDHSCPSSMSLCRRRRRRRVGEEEETRKEEQVNASAFSIRSKRHGSSRCDRQRRRREAEGGRVEANRRWQSNEDFARAEGRRAPVLMLSAIAAAAASGNKLYDKSSSVKLLTACQRGCQPSHPPSSPADSQQQDKPADICSPLHHSSSDVVVRQSEHGQARGICLHTLGMTEALAESIHLPSPVMSSPLALDATDPEETRVVEGEVQLCTPTIRLLLLCLNLLLSASSSLHPPPTLPHTSYPVAGAKHFSDACDSCARLTDQTSRTRRGRELEREERERGRGGGENIREEATRGIESVVGEVEESKRSCRAVTLQSLC
eukprot:763054-Hanusia_phi.AAC.6